MAGTDSSSVMASRSHSDFIMRRQSMASRLRDMSEGGSGSLSLSSAWSASYVVISHVVMMPSCSTLHGEIK